jgi:hypothetical protein
LGKHSTIVGGGQKASRARKVANKQSNLVQTAEQAARNGVSPLEMRGIRQREITRVMKEEAARERQRQKLYQERFERRGW